MNTVSDFSDFLRLVDQDSESLYGKMIEDRIVVLFLGLDQLDKQYETIQSTIESFTNNEDA